jgi:hypothetical protein
MTTPIFLFIKRHLLFAVVIVTRFATFGHTYLPVGASLRLGDSSSLTSPHPIVFTAYIENDEQWAASDPI